ncbi:MAG: hypothetical protein QM758_21355 [Armatimonas sp.]
MLCAGRLWWYANNSRESQLIGWDPVQNSWTAPLSIHNYSTKMRPIADSRGRVLMAVRSDGRNPDVTIHSWQPKTKLWETIATFPWASDGLPILITAGKDGIWLTDQKSLLRFDLAKKTLQQESLPESSENVVQLWAEDSEIFLITKERLWQFDRRQNTWQEWKVPVTATQLWPQLAASEGASLWGFLNARNAGPAPLFRFEPGTNRFSFFGENAGLPHSEGGQMIEAGGQIWWLHPTGAFRFDTAAQRFLHEVPFQARRIAASQSKAWVWIAGESAQKSDATLYRWSAASGKTVPEAGSIQNRCQALLSAGEGVLAATDNGLYRVDAESVWTLMDTLQMPVSQLMRASNGAVWATTNGPGFLRLTSAS